MAKSILLIEDDPGTLISLGTYLKHLDYQVVLARSAEEALSETSRQKFEIILLDLRLPGISGSDFLAEYLKNCENPARVVVITGVAPNHVDEEFDSVKKYPCLYKPFDADQIDAVLSRVA